MVYFICKPSVDTRRARTALCAIKSFVVFVEVTLGGRRYAFIRRHFARRFPGLDSQV